MNNSGEENANLFTAKKKKPVVWIVVVVVLMLVVGGVGYAWFLQKDQTDHLQSKVSALSKQVSASRTGAADSKTSATQSASTVKYREIPELGVKYKVTDQTKDLTYTYDSDEAGSVKTARFSTVAMSMMRDPQGESPCTSSHDPSGSISRYNDGGYQLMGAKVEDVAKKVGDFYILYSHPQYACSLAGSKPVEGLQASIDAVKAAYDSLEVAN